tara:strand:+ start:10842 stop:11036 length:195 start_codon:yes stop_codon:yes gene_type:complete
MDKYIRDENSNAVLNTDIAGLQAYKKRKSQDRELSSVKEDVDNLRYDIIEIKNMLREITRMANV